MKSLGTVLGVPNQSYPSVDVHTGTRLMRMIRNGPFAVFSMSGGTCAGSGIAGNQYCVYGNGHVSRNCPLKRESAACAINMRTIPDGRGDDWGAVVDASAGEANVGVSPDGVDFELDLGGPPFDDLRDKHLDELQSSPSQSILANAAVNESCVKESDLNSISSSESNLSIVSNNVSIAKEGNLVNDELLSESKESDLNNEIKKVN